MYVSHRTRSGRGNKNVSTITNLEQAYRPSIVELGQDARKKLLIIAKVGQADIIYILYKWFRPERPTFVKYHKASTGLPDVSCRLGSSRDKRKIVIHRKTCPGRHCIYHVELVQAGGIQIIGHCKKWDRPIGMSCRTRSGQSDAKIISHRRTGTGWRNQNLSIIVNPVQAYMMCLVEVGQARRTKENLIFANPVQADIVYTL